LADPDPSFLNSRAYPGDPFLLNRTLLINTTLPDGGPARFIKSSDTESVTGPVGALNIAPFSPVGVDVARFPQRRANNTFQFADTASFTSGKHVATVGFEA